MKVKTIILLLLTIITPILVFNTKKNIPIELTSKIDNKNNIKLIDNKFEINIEYPITEYIILNKEIKNTIDYYKNQFYIDLKEGITNEIKYTLYITYKEYNYNHYISYIFYIETFLGGPHPNSQLNTINYNIKQNEIITIDTLIRNNNNLLNILSYTSRKHLQNIDIFKEYDLTKIMTEGTIPIKDNFKNIILSKEGLIIFFERYQIAPYYFGEYNITIPYNKLNLNI